MLTAKKISLLKSLQQKKGRQNTGQFVVDNPKVILEQIKNPYLKELYVTESFLAKYKKDLAGATYRLISEAELKKISSSQTPQGMLAVFSLLPLVEFGYSDKNILLLDGIQDPGNVGTIIRTADWFGVRHIFLGKNCADIYNPKTVAASMGSIFQVRIHQVEDLAEFVVQLKNHGYKILASTLTGKSSILKAGKLAILIGSEAHGLSNELIALADCQYKIAGAGQAESLNAAVAAGIILSRLIID